jgi:hypothetical protein
MDNTVENKNNYEYSHERKKKLVDKISKIRDKKDIVKIFKIIYADNKSISENNNGLFMLFHELKDTTYDEIENEIKKINKQKKYLTVNGTVSPEKTSTKKKEYRPYVQDEFPSQKGISPKLKFSNKEKTIIQKMRNDKNINLDKVSNVIYTTFDVDTQTDSDINWTEIKNDKK